MLKSKEHYDLMTQFETEFKGKRLDREDKTLWSIGQVYQNGEVNELFKAYRRGYSLGRVIERDETA